MHAIVPNVRAVIVKSLELINSLPHEPAIDHENHFAHNYPQKNNAPWSILAIFIGGQDVARGVL
jgi:hypothetical protein